jgi:hypothetical protein
MISSIDETLVDEGERRSNKSSEQMWKTTHRHEDQFLNDGDLDARKEETTEGEG